MLVIAAPSYAVNVFVAKPMTVAATSFFIHLVVAFFLALSNTSNIITSYFVCITHRNVNTIIAPYGTIINSKSMINSKN